MWLGCHPLSFQGFYSCGFFWSLYRSFTEAEVGEVNTKSSGNDAYSLPFTALFAAIGVFAVVS